MDQGRLPGADFVRAVACLLVLAHHLVLRLDVSNVSPDWKGYLDFARFGSFGVTVFFVLSGFLLSRPFWQALDDGAEMPSIRIYALRRAARILPGFWLALTVGFILSFAVFDNPLNIELVWRYLSGFFLLSQFHWSTFFPVPINGPLWSIPFETTSYVLLSLCFLPVFALSRAFVASRLVWIGIIGLALFVHFLITRIPVDPIGRGWEFGMQGGAKEWMPRFNPVGFFSVFALGVLAAGIRTFLPKPGGRLWDIIGLCSLVMASAIVSDAVGGSWEGYGWLSIPYGFPSVPIAIAVGLAALSVSSFMGQWLDYAIARYIATVSFGVYIWQDIVIHLIKKAVPWSFTGPFYDPLTLWLVSCAVATVAIFTVATASYLLIERPVVRWARRLETRLR